MCVQPILYAGLQLIVPKYCRPTTVSYEERDENYREPSPGGWWRVIKHFPSKTLQEPLCFNCSTRPSIIMKKYNTWGQHSSSLVLNKGNRITARTVPLAGYYIVLGMFTGSLRAQNYQVRCVAIDGYTRDIVQNICAKFHLILTVHSGPESKSSWKKLISSLLSYIFPWIF